MNLKKKISLWLKGQGKHLCIKAFKLKTEWWEGVWYKGFPGWEPHKGLEVCVRVLRRAKTELPECVCVYTCISISVSVSLSTSIIYI